MDKNSANQNDSRILLVNNKKAAGLRKIPAAVIKLGDLLHVMQFFCLTCQFLAELRVSYIDQRLRALTNSFTI